MSDMSPVESGPSQSGGHPHDLLARLYREIGISAVAAALQVSRSDVEDDEYQAPWVPLGEDLAA
jgi:hypothetical protein